jgi:hypothetical protein
MQEAESLHDPMARGFSGFPQSQGISMAVGRSRPNKQRIELPKRFRTVRSVLIQ